MAGMKTHHKGMKSHGKVKKKTHAKPHHHSAKKKM